MARGLNVDRVVGAAIELADADGLAAVSMARVAERLGFTPMSLYRHVSGKDELVRRMLEVALGTPPPYTVAGWRARLEAWARGVLAGVEEHPWVIDVPITGMIGTNAQLAWMDRGLEALADTALDEGEKAELLLLLNGYVFWAARLRFQIPDDPDLPFVPAEIDLSALPALRRAIESGIFEDDTTREEDFAFGLERVLDGVAALVARRLTDRG